MGTKPSLSANETTVLELADACPELKVIIAGHEHKLIEGMEENGVLIVENPAGAKSIAEVTLKLECDGSGCRVTDRQSAAIPMKEVEPDQEIVNAVAEYDQKEKEYADSFIGFGFHLKGDVNYGPILSDTGRSTEEIIQNQLKVSTGTAMDTAEVDLIMRSFMYYSKADVCAYQTTGGNVPSLITEITRSELFRAMKYNNNLMLLEMSGDQLKKYMEWSAAWLLQMNSDTDPIDRDMSLKGHFYDAFQGVQYRINLAKPAGERICGLTFNGQPVQPDDHFKVAVTDFRANNVLLAEDGLFSGEAKPQVLIENVREDLGGTQGMLFDFIENVHGTDIELFCDGNWEIVYRP